jgi:hypothetical protein
LIRSLAIFSVVLGLIIIFTDYVSSESFSVEHNNAVREDYGCLHERHSQYDDGDSLNLEAASDTID